MIFKYNDDDLFDDSYFQFELLTMERQIKLSIDHNDFKNKYLQNKVVYYSESFVNDLYYIDIEKDIEFKLVDLFAVYTCNSFIDIQYTRLPFFCVNWETLCGYNNGITDLLKSDNSNINKLGFELFKLNLYKEFRKHFIPKFKNIKTQ